MGETVFFGDSISLSAFSRPEIYISLAIFVVMALLAFRKVHPILIIAISAVVGIGVGFIPGIVI